MINWWTWTISNHRPSVWSVSEESTPDCGFWFLSNSPHLTTSKKRRWQWKKENFYLLSHIGSMGLLNLPAWKPWTSSIHVSVWLWFSKFAHPNVNVENLLFSDGDFPAPCQLKLEGMTAKELFNTPTGDTTGGVDLLSRVAPAYVCGRSSFCEGCGQLVTCRLAHGNHGKTEYQSILGLCNLQLRWEIEKKWLN